MKKYLVLIALVTLLLFASTGSAITWTSSNGCWTATDGAYNLRMWNTTGTDSWSAPSVTTDYLVIAGGAGGGRGRAGGGGAGGFINGSLSISGTISVTVGAGAPGSQKGPSNSTSSGGFSKFSSINATGGGYGTGYGDPAAGSGGSGGGEGYLGTNPGASAFPPFQGFAGSLPSGTASGAGGGGGAGQTPTQPSGPDGGKGGDGNWSNIDGTWTRYSAGGGGGSRSIHGVGGDGGQGGGGAGSGTTRGSDATWYGSAGGGGAYNDGTGASYDGGNGYQGIVIIRYSSVVAPVASFTKNATEGVSPLVVQFTDTSSNSPTERAWNFTEIGNNTPVTFASTPNPTYTFPTGNYSIKLNATNSAGSNISAAEHWINVSAGTLPPLSMFSKSKSTIRVPGTLVVNDTSLGGLYAPTSWDYGWLDGTANGTMANASHKYVKRGIFNVSHKVSNSAGSSWNYSIVKVIGYDMTQGAGPGGIGIPERYRADAEWGTYSVSRELSLTEKLMTECKLFGLCET